MNEININKYLNYKYFEIFWAMIFFNEKHHNSIQFKYIETKMKNIPNLSAYKYIKNVSNQIYFINQNLNNNKCFIFGDYIINNNIACYGQKVMIADSMKKKEITMLEDISNVYINDILLCLKENEVWSQIYEIAAYEYKERYEVCLFFTCFMCFCAQIFCVSVPKDYKRKL